MNTTEQEQHHHPDVVRTVALQEEPVQPEPARAAMAGDAAQWRRSAEVGDRPDAAELEREADRVIRKQRDRERGDVHHHHVGGVLRAGETRHQEREPDLHEQHEKAGHEHPDEVDRDAEVTAVRCECVDARLRELDAGGRRIVGEPVEGRSGGIARAVMTPRRPDDGQRDEGHQAQRDEFLCSRHVSSPRPHAVAGVVVANASV
jgi:hypothetical protein